MSAGEKAGRGELCVITSYFNPAGYRRRLLNYRRFRAALQVPLAAVELSFDGCWELADDDADYLVRVGQMTNRTFSKPLSSKCFL